MEKTYIHKVRITQVQKDAFVKLKEYDVNISQFIRQAIKEKLQRDWKSIKESKNKTKCPF
jgi:post-segregation antitoxin (ccd killing protein)